MKVTRNGMQWVVVVGSYSYCSTSFAKCLEWARKEVKK